MNDAPQAEITGGAARPGREAFATTRGLIALVVEMVRTRLTLASLDIDAHVRATFAALVLGIAALGLGLLALAFLGLTVVVAFWETHRLTAAAGVMLAYATLGGIAARLALVRWRTRPGVLGTTLGELERDWQALREHA